MRRTTMLRYRKQLCFYLCALLACMGVMGCGKQETGSEHSQELLVMAAASMTDVLQELADEYKKENESVTLNFTFASSGALQTQIEEGAPADLFISAAQKQMEALQEKEFIRSDTRTTLLENKVVLITPETGANTITTFEDLAKSEIKKVGLGEPASVPVGQYSEEVLNHLGILNEVTAKAVYGSDVRTVLSWVESGEVDAGIVYATDAATTSKVQVICEAPEGSLTPVTYPAAVIKTSKSLEEAKKFLEFLSTDTAANIFESYGFSMY